MWKIILIVLAISATIAAGITWRVNDVAHWKQVGRNELLNEIKKAEEEQEQKTLKLQKDRRQKERKTKDEIKQNLDGDRYISPVLKRQLDRMRASD